jgi:hypothetical protein
MEVVIRKQDWERLQKTTVPERQLEYGPWQHPVNLALQRFAQLPEQQRKGLSFLQTFGEALKEERQWAYLPYEEVHAVLGTMTERLLKTYCRLVLQPSTQVLTTTPVPTVFWKKRSDFKQLHFYLAEDSWSTVKRLNDSCTDMKKKHYELRNVDEIVFHILKMDKEYIFRR